MRLSQNYFDRLFHCRQQEGKTKQRIPEGVMGNIFTSLYGHVTSSYVRPEIEVNTQYTWLTCLGHLVREHGRTC